VIGYHPMTLADLAGRLARTPDVKVRWKLVWEFLEEYRWEPDDVSTTVAAKRRAGPSWRCYMGRAVGGAC